MSSHRNVHTYLSILRRDLSRFSAESAKLRLIPTKSEYSGTIRGEDIALTAGGKLTIVEEVKIGARSARMKVSRTSYKYKYVDGAGNTVFRYECNPYGRNDWVDHPLHHLHVGNVETRYMTQPPRLAWVVRFVHECKPGSDAVKVRSEKRAD